MSLLAAAFLFMIMTGVTTPLEPRVGPANGTVMLVGGGAQSPSLFRRFITLAGGRDALIIDIPTAGLDTTYGQDARTARILRWSGARNVVVLHTFKRDSANSDSVRALFARAGGVWFGGGRQGRLIDAYRGTAVEQGLRDVLARGGVVGGTSAGASILASFLVRGSPAIGGGIIHEGYTTGFGLLRATAVDQHAAVRGRLRDLPDTVLRQHPELLGIALDEGAGLIVRGDTATVVGRSNVFVYGHGVALSGPMPYRLLRVGESFDLGARSFPGNAADASRIAPMDTALLQPLALRQGARAVLLASRHGRVVATANVDTSVHPGLLPATSRLSFRLGRVSNVLHAGALHFAVCDGAIAPSERIGSNPALRVDSVLMDDRMFARHRTQTVQLISNRAGITYPEFVRQKLLWPLGMTHTAVDDRSGDVFATADDLFRLGLAVDDWRETRAVAQTGDATPCDSVEPTHTAGWQRDAFGGRVRYTAESNEPGANHLFVRVPECGISVVLLTDDNGADVRRTIDGVLKRLLAGCPTDRSRSPLVPHILTSKR